MENAQPMTDSEIKIAGIEVLNKALGPAYALRFLSLLHHDTTDYIQISQKIYDGQTIEQIWERAKTEWPDK